MAPLFGILPGESLGIPNSGVDPDSLLRKMLSRVFGSGTGLDLPDPTQTTAPSTPPIARRRVPGFDPDQRISDLIFGPSLGPEERERLAQLNRPSTTERILSVAGPALCDYAQSRMVRRRDRTPVLLAGLGEAGLNTAANIAGEKRRTELALDQLSRQRQRENISEAGTLSQIERNLRERQPSTIESELLQRVRSGEMTLEQAADFLKSERGTDQEQVITSPETGDVFLVNKRKGTYRPIVPELSGVPTGLPTPPQQEASPTPQEAPTLPGVVLPPLKIQPKKSKPTSPFAAYMEAAGGDSAKALEMWRRDQRALKEKPEPKPKPPAKSLLRSIESRKGDRLNSLEQRYHLDSDAGMFVNPSNPNDAMSPEEFTAAKQRVQDQYESELSAAGIEPEHYEYGQPKSANRQPQRGGIQPGSTVMYRGKRHRVVGISNGQAQLQPIE